MESVAVGALKTAKVMHVSCGAPDCEGKHETYDCKDVLFIMEGVDLAVAQENEALASCLADGRMVAAKTRAFPTMLGIWWEGVCDN